MSWVPIFDEITSSSIQMEPLHVRWAFLCICASKDHKTHQISLTPGRLAVLAQITKEEATEALETLSSPDEDSGSEKEKGRRLLRLEGTYYQVVTAEDYKNKMYLERDRASARDRMNRSRSVAAQLPHEIDPPPEKEKKPKKEPKYSDDVKEVLQFLNEQSGRSFGMIKTNLDKINARLKEPGVTVIGCKMMITRQVKKWTNTKWEDFLRPATLFGAQKFQGYYAAKDQSIKINEENGNGEDGRLQVKEKNGKRITDGLNFCDTGMTMSEVQCMRETEPDKFRELELRMMKRIPDWSIDNYVFE